VQRYDPLEAPNPEEWLELDEQERIDLVRDYHRRAGIHLPNEKLHATLHAIVEAQIALGEETPAGRIAQRLISEGLDRHDAIHAIGMVLAEHLYDVWKRRNQTRTRTHHISLHSNGSRRKIGGGRRDGDKCHGSGPCHGCTSRKSAFADCRIRRENCRLCGAR
jgi:Domain of unknown function (DUF1841)